MPNIICFNNFWNGFLSNDPINYNFFILSTIIELLFRKAKRLKITGLIGLNLERLDH